MHGDVAPATVWLEESLARSRELGDTRLLGWALFFRGILSRMRGDAAAAGADLRESLALGRTAGSNWLTAYSLLGLAGMAGEEGSAERSARLLAAGLALLEGTVGAPLTPVFGPEIERIMTRARALLGDAQFEAAWATGAAQSLEQAIGEALAMSDVEGARM